MMAGALHYFWIVTPYPRVLLGGWVGVLLLAAWQMAAGEIDPTGLVSLLLYLQMFGASTGFRVPARLGHFDALLVSGRRRSSIALAHWLTSAAPGLAAWIVMGGVERVLRHDGGSLALHGSSLVAMLLVSTISWTLTLTLPRWSGGVLWTLLLVGLGTTGPGVAFIQTAAMASPVETVGNALRLTLAVAACPFVLLNHTSGPIAATSAPILVGASAVAVMTLGAGVWLITSQDYPIGLQA